MPRSGLGGPIGHPLSKIAPPLAGSKPPTMWRNVLLPQPEGPTIDTNSCSSIANESLSIALTALLLVSNFLSSSLTSSSAIELRETLFRQVAEIDQGADID